MGDENPIRTLVNYSRPSHEGYRNIIELLNRNNVVPLRSNTIQLGKDAPAFISIFPCDQARNWLKHLSAGSISTWEDLTTRESLSEAWTRFKDLLQKVHHHGNDLWLQIQIFYDHVSFHLKCEIDRAAGGKLRDKNVEESWEIIKNLALYDHEGWDDPRDITNRSWQFLELEDQISFLIKGSRTTPRTS
ncbi:hypothetical protein Tco_0718818 [Tanacetum coccineum]